MNIFDKVTAALCLGGIAIVVALMVGCDEPLVGWDPATMRCREFDGTIFVGPFLDSEKCAGKPKPVEIQPEVQS